MAAPLIAALRRRTDLKESVLHTAQELAHRASIYGVVPPTSYDFLAEKSHCSSRTAIRHVRRLEDARILQAIRQKRIMRRKDLPPGDRQYSDDPVRGCQTVMRNEINLYRFLIQWDKSPHRSHGSSNPYDTMSQNLPTQEREKGGSVREDLERQKKGIRYLTPGTERWQAVQEDIARLEALLRE